MNIYDFINSKAISRYCQEIKHSFTPLQAAYFINYSQRHTLAEKHKAFQWVMETMPDDEIALDVNRGDDNWHQEKRSLRWFLNMYMDLQKKCLDRFWDVDGNSVYECVAYYTPIDYTTYQYYKRAGDVLTDIDRDLQDEEQAPIKIVMKKIVTDGSNKGIGVSFNSDREVTDVCCKFNMTDEESEIMEGLEHVCFVCPIPFKKGDIVYAPLQREIYMPYAYEPFVLRHVWYEYMSEGEREEYTSGKYSDSADMVAYGFFQEVDGRIYYECMHDYLSLEYYDGNMDGRKRILKAVSNFLKGEISIDLLVNAYHIIMNEENTKEMLEKLHFTDEGLRLAGLILANVKICR